MDTVQPHNKDGVRMKRDTYSTLKKFILDQFETENEITVNSIVGKSKIVINHYRTR